MWWGYALLSAVFAGLTAILAKIGVKGVDSNLATAIRTTVILVLAWGVVLLTGTAKTINHLSVNTWIFLGLSGIATGLSWLFYFRALQIGNVSQVAPIDKFSLVFTVVLSILILKEKINWGTAVGVLLMTVRSLLVLVWK